MLWGRHRKERDTMKKLLALMLAAAMLMTIVPSVFAEDDLPFDEEELAPEVPEIIYDYDELTVAFTTPLTGNFFTSLWGNGTSDLDVRALLHGYNLVEWSTEEGMFLENGTVVDDLVVTEDDTGDRTYTITLQTDLYYSDGSPITAWDYAFSMLLVISNEMEALGGNVRRPDYLRGYEEYMNGTAPALAGMRVLADDQLAFIVKGEYLPFFYELGLLDCQPYPMAVIAPGVGVADDGDGVYLTNRAAFTADVLRRTVLDPVNGYRGHPSVISGPYRLVSWNNGEARFELNPRFKGDAQGSRPTIQRLVLKSMAQQDLIPALADGSVQLLNKMTDAQVISDGLALVADNPIMTMTDYARSGLSFISFVADRAPLDDLALRQALAYLVDREGISDETVSNYGQRADGYFGLGQWMYRLVNGTVEPPVEEPGPGASAEEREAYEKEMEGWEELSMDDVRTYDADEEAAVELLNEAGWSLNDQGESFTAGVDQVRCRQTENGLTPLKLALAYPAGSAAAPALEALPEALAAEGVQLTVTALPMSELVMQYYRMAETQYDMYFLATNFELVYDLSSAFVETEDGRHVWKSSGVESEKMWEEAAAMRQTEAGDLLTYCTHWLEFQKEFAEVLPVLPIYSNVYFDFYPRVLHDYVITTHATWPQAIIPAYLADDEEPAEEEDAEEEFEIIP